MGEPEVSQMSHQLFLHFYYFFCFIGIGVFMLVALTVERYLAVCRLGRTRAFAAQKTPLVAIGLALLAISLYLPYLFRANVITCLSVPDGLPVYRKRENPSFAHSTIWAAYLWTLEVIFKVKVHFNFTFTAFTKCYYSRFKG